MKSKAKMMAAIAGAVVVSAAGAGGAVWWLMPKPAVAAGADKKAEAEKPKDGKPAKYVTLSTDLVLATTAAKEKETKENLPLLRSLAVRTLSGYTMTEASTMTVEKYAEQLNQSFNAAYEHEHTEKPFSEVMIGKLIIE